MSDQQIKTKLAAATDRWLALQVDTGTTADTANRFELMADGTMKWGSGSGAVDLVLARSAAGVLNLSTGIFTQGGIGTANTLVTLATATILTAATHAGRTLLLTGTGSSLAQTLPAATGSGNVYMFVVAAVNTSNHVIQVTTNDVMYGQIMTCSTSDTPDLSQPWITAVDSDTITLNGTTTGGLAIGDYIRCQDIATDKWMVWGFTTTSGTEATPFSAAVT